MRRPGLRLVTQMEEPVNEIDDVHCPLCLFREFNEIPCYHKPDKPLPPLPIEYQISTHTTQASSPTSTRRFSPSGYSRYFVSAAEAAEPQSPTDSESSVSSHNRYLRRKPSPTTATLRELRARHSQHSLLRSMQSDEQLQLVYESQIMAYLMSPLSERDVFA